MAQEKFEAARQANRESHSIWLALNNLPMAADAYTIKMGIHHFTGEYEAIAATAPEALRLSQRIGNLLHQNQTLNLQGLVHGRQVWLGQAVANVEQAMTINIGVEQTVNAGGFWLLLLIYYLNGMLDQAEVWANKLSTTSPTTPDRMKCGHCFQPCPRCSGYWTREEEVIIRHMATAVHD